MPSATWRPGSPARSPSRWGVIPAAPRSAGRRRWQRWAAGGVATFVDLSLNKTGTGYTLTASASGFTPGTSTTFDITPGTATQLAFIVQPSNTVAGAAISPAVQVTALDPAGNPVPGFTGSVTVALGSRPGE